MMDKLMKVWIDHAVIIDTSINKRITYGELKPLIDDPSKITSDALFHDEKQFNNVKSWLISDDWPNPKHPTALGCCLAFGIAYYLNLMKQEIIHIDDIPELLLIDRRMLDVVEGAAIQIATADRTTDEHINKLKCKNSTQQETDKRWEQIENTILHITDPLIILNKQKKLSMESIAYAIRSNFEKVNRSPSLHERTIIRHLENYLSFTSQTIEKICNDIEETEEKAKHILEYLHEKCR
jgi:hypothetical protein